MRIVSMDIIYEKLVSDCFVLRLLQLEEAKCSLDFFYCDKRRALYACLLFKTLLYQASYPLDNS